MTRSHEKLATSLVPGGPFLKEERRRWPVAAIIMTVVLATYVAAARFFFGPEQPLLRQRLLGLGCGLLALAPFLLFTRRKPATKADLFRVRLAKLSDFGKNLLPSNTGRRRTVRLPGVGEISVRLLGGAAVFFLMFLWWWTPLAPVRVKGQAVEDLTALFGEEIVTAVLVVPNGRMAVLAPPIVPPRAEHLAQLIGPNATAYQRGLRAIAEGRHDEAVAALEAASRDGKVDPVQVLLARAQNEMFAGKFGVAAAMFEELLRRKPKSAMFRLQTAVAWLHAGAAKTAEPHVIQAIRASPGGTEEKNRELAYCYHVLVVLQVAQGRFLAETNQLCLETRRLIEESAGKPYSFFAASLNNEAVLSLLHGKYPEATSLLEKAGDNWTNAFGPRHAWMAACFDNKAALYVMDKKYAEAQEALSAAESLLGNVVPTGHPLAAYTLTCRAFLQEALGH